VEYFNSDSEIKQKLISKKISGTVRIPASLREIKPLYLNKEFFCKNSKNTIQNKWEQSIIMINFKICSDPETLSHITFENLSNGFKAHIFKMEDGSFKTDYIQLDSNINKLKLVVEKQDGQRLEESLEILLEQ